MIEHFGEAAMAGEEKEIPDRESEKKDAAQELGREAVAAEAEFFLDLEMLLRTIADAWKSMREGDQGDPDVRQNNPDGTLTPFGVLQEHKDQYLRGWSELLLQSAEGSFGSERALYAEALKKLRLLVGEDIFQKETKGLNASISVIEDLIKKGQEESGGNGLPYRGF